MPAIDIHLCGKGELIGWPEAEVSHHVTDGLRVAILAGGTVSGAPSMRLRVPMPDGTVTLVEMTARMWLLVSAAIVGRHGSLESWDADA